MNELLDRIEAKKQEQQRLLDTLRVWAVAREAGYAEDQIKAFTFRDAFLTAEQKYANRRAGHPYRPTNKVGVPYNSVQWHNAVRLNDDRVVPIPIVKRPS